jgi:hypothetical protein
VKVGSFSARIRFTDAFPKGLLKNSLKNDRSDTAQTHPNRISHQTRIIYYQTCIRTLARVVAPGEGQRLAPAAGRR